MYKVHDINFTDQSVQFNFKLFSSAHVSVSVYKCARY